MGAPAFEFLIFNFSMPNKFKFKPIPDIYRFPETEIPSADPSIEPTIIPQEPPLDGPPKSNQDSAFYHPGINYLAEQIKKYEIANSAQKNNVANSIANHLLNNPAAWENFNDGIAIIQTEDELVKDIPNEHLSAPSISADNLAELKKRVDKNLDHQKFNPWPPEPKTLEKWLSLYSESALHAKESQRILRIMVDKCRDPKDVIDLFYNLSLAGITSSNEQIVSQTLKILTFNSPILSAEDRQALDYILAEFDLDDDVLKKAMEVDHTVLFIATVTGQRELINHKESQIKSFANNPAFLERLKKIIQANPERFRAINEMYQSPEGELGLSRVKDPNKFPFSLAGKPGPLRQWCNERIAREVESREGGPAVNLALPLYEGTVAFKDHAEIAKYIASHLNQPNPDQQSLSEPKFWQTLTYLKPELNDTQQKQLAQLNRNLTDGLKYNAQYFLNPSGDQIKITDPLLTELGFKQIKFKMDPRNRRDTEAELMIGSFPYKIVIDEFTALRNIETLDSLLLPKAGDFLKHIILSHLHAIRCGAEVIGEAGAESAVHSGGDANQSATALARPRRAHRRQLPKGHKPTPEQIELAMREYDVDLIRENAERAARGLGPVTFVKEVTDVSYSSPIISRATPEVTAELQRIITSTAQK